MRLFDDEYILRCQCQDLRHAVHLRIWNEYDGEKVETGLIKLVKRPRDLNISLYVDTVPLFQRIKNSLLYIFKQEAFWHYGDITVDLKDIEDRCQLQEIINFIGEALDASAVKDGTEELEEE